MTSSQRLARTLADDRCTANRHSNTFNQTFNNQRSMKKNMRILCGLTALAIVVVAILGVLGIVDFETAIGAGAMLATAPAAAPAESTDTSGSVGTNTVEGGKVVSHPEMNKDTISEKLAKILPSNFPLDTFLRNIGSGKTKSDKYGFYSIIARGTSAKPTATVTAETDGPTTIKVDNIHCLSKDGCLMVPSYNVADGEATKSSNGPALNPLVLNIVNIDYAQKQITVSGINAPCPALTSTDVLYRMAAAKDQDAAMSDDPQATPTKAFNWVQRNLCTISENAFQALQEKEVKYGLAEFKEQAILDFRYQNEITSLFGAAYRANDGEFVDPVSQKRKLHMKGLTSFIQNRLSVAEGETVEKFLNRAMEALFANNNGSEERLLLYGPGFATALANSGAFDKQLEAGKTEVKWGVTWKVIETNFGRLLGIMHTGLGMVGYENAGVVIDPANIRRIEQLPLQQTVLDLKKAGQRNSNDVTLDEAWTLEVTNPNTHGLLFIA